MGITDQTGNGKRRKVSEAAKAARAEYARKWRAANPGKQQQYNDNYWERKAKAAANARKTDSKAANIRNSTQAGECATV